MASIPTFFHRPCLGKLCFITSLLFSRTCVRMASVSSSVCESPPEGAAGFQMSVLIPVNASLTPSGLFHHRASRPDETEPLAGLCWQVLLLLEVLSVKQQQTYGKVLSHALQTELCSNPLRLSFRPSVQVRRSPEGHARVTPGSRTVLSGGRR